MKAIYNAIRLDFLNQKLLPSRNTLTNGDRTLFSRSQGLLLHKISNQSDTLSTKSAHFNVSSNSSNDILRPRASKNSDYLTLKGQISNPLLLIVNELIIITSKGHESKV